MSRPPVYPKIIDDKPRTFYRFKINNTTYSLFDDELNTSVVYGPINSYDNVKNFIPENSKIFYFTIDKNHGWAKEKKTEIVTEQIKQDNKKRGGYRPVNYPKKINADVLLYFHYEISPTIFALFDVMMDTPVIYGSKQQTALFINNAINPRSIIYYFNKNDDIGLKYKATYRPDKTTATSTEKKIVIERVKEKLKQKPITDANRD